MPLPPQPAFGSQVPMFKVFVFLSEASFWHNGSVCRYLWAISKYFHTREDYMGRHARRSAQSGDFLDTADKNRAFSLTWPASMQIYWNKRKCLHLKRVQLPQDWLRTPTWPPFRCFGTPKWPLWRHVKTLYTSAGFHITSRFASILPIVP